MLAVNAGTRFMKSDPRPSKTFNGTASYSNLPGIKALLSLSANLMQTSYLDGQVYGARLSKDFIQGKISTMLNYRYVDFKYANVNSELRQNIGEIDLTYQFNKKLYMSVNFESTFQDKENFNRLYLSLRWKF
jgi:predicted porin